MSHAFIDDGARIGKNCKISSYAAIGIEPQDLKYAGEKTYAVIGDNTMVREFATISRGTAATGMTEIGHDSLIMAYAHIAHDCKLSHNVRITNAVQLAGHVSIEENAIIGGLSAIHQFCKIGRNVMIGGAVKIVKDVPPYVLVGSNPPKVDGLNKIGLLRAGFAGEVVKEIERFYLAIFKSGLNNSDGITKYRAEHREIIPEVLHCIEFIEASNRGVYRMK